MEKQKLTPEELILKAQTVCGAQHTIKSKVLELKGHLLKYVGTVVHEDKEIGAEWNPEGRLIGLGGGLPFGDLVNDYRLIVVEKITES